VFPKDLFEFLVQSSNSFSKLHYQKKGEQMLPPRMHEISGILGNEGIASIADGNMYYLFS
jgi:hypothetical protein